MIETGKSSILSRGFVIGGTHSGCGKTTITMGILAAFRKRGFDIQPWKAGPDYIDPGFHTKASGRVCRNLDTMMLNEDVVKEIYSMQQCDFSIIEGVMGLFDGAGGIDERGSAAHLSKVLKLPVIVVIDAKAMARSAGAIALGLSTYDPDLDIAGFIVNRIGSDNHYKMVKTAIEDCTPYPVFGSIPNNLNLTVPERHLGLKPEWNSERFDSKIDKLIDVVEQKIDLESITNRVMNSSKQITFNRTIFNENKKIKAKVKIAVARDNSFNFYYEENLDLLRHHGAEIEFFSPLNDEQLPKGVSGLYFGGGYPELHAKKLSENYSLIEEIRSYSKKGIPIFGECGGYIYLSEGYIDEESFYPMLSLLPGKVSLGKKLKSLGYCDVKINKGNILGSSGVSAKGHLFHWATIDLPENEEFALRIKKGDDLRSEGVVRDNVFGSWVHFHFASNPLLADSFVKKAEEFLVNDKKADS